MENSEQRARLVGALGDHQRGLEDHLKDLCIEQRELDYGIRIDRLRAEELEPRSFFR